MCGLTGFWQSERKDNLEMEHIVSSMMDSIVHRGPDDDGVWISETDGLALGFRRLAIVDLSPQGHQPMESASGRYMMAFNGEVYNFGELHTELESRGHLFRGHSDTEVMLAAIDEWGLVAAVERFIGMFAIALWDKQNRTLSLVRDRIGIKPVYYGYLNGVLLFGSELKAIVAHPCFHPEVDRSALGLFIRHGYIPAPYSIYRGIHKLAPAAIKTFRFPNDRAEPVSYWSAKAVAEQGTSTPFGGSEGDAIDHLDTLLRDAIKLRMVADVPLGAFLSGGVDSSTVVALMQAQSPQPVKTFSIGFLEAGYNEATYAKEVAQHLGTQHTELYVTPSEAQVVIPSLPDMFDEPFADSSQIPTYLVSALARKHVTVSLSGDGGDELFCGYGRYFSGEAAWRWIDRVPPRARKGLGFAMRALGSPPSGLVNRNLARRVRSRLHRSGEALSISSMEMFYHRLLSQCGNDLEDHVIEGREPLYTLNDSNAWAQVQGIQPKMMFLDLLTYLPDDILVKVDRASMAVSLEARVPLIDHRVVEFAWRLPMSLKVRQGQGKWILRQVLDRYVPRNLIERPKMGFGVPIGEWLRGPLRDWAEDLLDERRLRQEGFLRPEPILARWSNHVAGTINSQYYLWNVLMFQAWKRRWIGPS